MRLHHLALGAVDVERLATFYQNAFELEEDRRHHYDDGTLRSVWLRLDPGVLMIEHVTDHRTGPVTMEPGLFLIAFEVDASTRASVEDRLVETGAIRQQVAENTSYFEDPEGNRVAVSQFALSTS